MIGISEVIQTLGAMVIFSLILLTANRMIQMNALKEVETEAESTAVELAQGVIEEAQTKPFDANTADNNIPSVLPEGFSSCGPANNTDRNDFDDYDNSDGNGYSEDKNTALGIFHVEARVFYIEPPDYDKKANKKTFYKKIIVTVNSDYIKNKTNEIKLSYLRRYYKTRD